MHSGHSTHTCIDPNPLNPGDCHPTPRQQTTSPLHHRSPPQPQFHNAARNRHASNRCPRGNQRGAPLDQKDLGGPIRVPHAPQAVLRTVSNVFFFFHFMAPPNFCRPHPLPLHRTRHTTPTCERAGLSPFVSACLDCAPPGRERGREGEREIHGCCV